MTSGGAAPRGPLQIFPSRHAAPLDVESDGERLLLVSIGAGETRVSCLVADGRPAAGWTAVFGWSRLCDLPSPHGAPSGFPRDDAQLAAALAGRLRNCGRPVETGGFLAAARIVLRDGLAEILDRTVGDASDWDRVVLAAPPWLHPALERCLALRPHLSSRIEDL